jgi:two-component system sensor histidine kinase KdpD
MTTGGSEGAATRALADVDAVRRRVLNVVGHALRTPVTTMAGMAAALGTTEDAATRAMLVDGLIRNAGRVERLLDDLLLAAGVTTALPAGDADRRPVRDTLAAAWDAIGGSGCLDVDGPDAAPLVHAAAFERIVELVLDNALKYGDGPVTARTIGTADRVRVEIESTGVGPTDEELEHAFEFLYRGEHAVMASPGLGIGLPVARRLAQGEGGDVTLERRGRSLVTSVELPA